MMQLHTKIYTTLLLLISLFVVGATAAQNNKKKPAPQKPKLAKVEVVTPAPAKEAPAEASKAPQLSAEEKLQVREFQLKDQQVVVQIQQRQLEIRGLQDFGTKNALDLNGYAKSLCQAPGGVKYEVDLSALTCKEVPKETKEVKK